MLLCATGSAADEIYQYQNSQGTTVYTNKPVKNAQKIKLPPLTVYAAPMTRADYHATSYTPDPQRNLKIAVKPTKLNLATSGRRQLLNEELQHEQQGLKDAQLAAETALVSEKNNQYQVRLQAVHDAITEHKKNIAILNTQLNSDE